MNDVRVLSEYCKNHTNKSNGYSVEVPCAVGTIVWYKNASNESCTKCIVDSYTIHSKDTQVHLIPVDDDKMADIQTSVDNFGTLILLDEPNANNGLDIHLYQAIARYDFSNPFIFEVDDLLIDHIEDDCTVVTKYFHSVGATTISNRFAGVNTLNVGKEIELGYNYFVFYSTDKKKCEQFIGNHIDIAELRISRYHNRIDEFRKEFNKEM